MVTFAGLHAADKKHKMDFHKLLTRTLSGIVYCGIIFGAVILGRWGIAALGTIISTLAIVEFVKICHDLNPKEYPLLAIDIAACICLAFTVINPGVFFIWVFLMLVRLIAQLYVKSANPVSELSHSLMGQVYIGLPIVMMSGIALMWSPRLILLIFVLLWANDTGAFLIGSLFGKHRLFERISPKKSWEGFFGGMAISVGAAILFYYLCPHFFGMARYMENVWIAICFALVTTVFGTWGDLVESMIKRNLHIKDSGNMIPGHGGILDRIDSVLLALPACFLYLLLIQLLF